VTQTHLESLSGEQIQALLRGLIDRNAEFTRLDPSLDDTAGITPGVSGVEAALERGDVATRAKSYNASGDRAFGGDRLGHMVTVGKRISDSYLRCYDKALESYRKACATVKAGQPAPAKPEPCTRFELELKNERAHLAAIELACADLERWPALVAGWISGHCDFREQGTGSGNITRATRLSWWASFIGNAERAYLSTPKPVQTVERAIAYVQRQLSPLLSALLQGAYGGDLGAFVSDLVDPGRPRWKARHHHLAAAVT
jgi:phage replication initiation protein